MSDQLSPFGGATATAVTEPPAEADEATTSGRGKLFALLGVAGALALGLAAYFLLFAGGEPEETAAPRPRASSPAGASTQPSAKPSAPAVKPSIPPTSTARVGRDPFEAAVEVPQPESSTGTTSGSTDPFGTGTTTTTGGTKVVVSLLDVLDDSSSLTVSVDGKVYNGVKVGTAFATYFKTYGIFDGRCAGFLFGDQTVALCEKDTATLTR